MPIYVGGNKQGELYVGGQKIAEAYVGSQLVYRAVPPLLPWSMGLNVVPTKDTPSPDNQTWAEYPAGNWFASGTFIRLESGSTTILRVQVQAATSGATAVNQAITYIGDFAPYVGRVCSLTGRVVNTSGPITGGEATYFIIRGYSQPGFLQGTYQDYVNIGLTAQGQTLVVPQTFTPVAGFPHIHIIINPYIPNSFGSSSKWAIFENLQITV